MNRNGITITSECLKMLDVYCLSNIRELRNVVERSLIVCEHEITLDDLPVDIRMNSNQLSSRLEFDLATVECNHIAKILDYTNGNKTEIVHLLKIGFIILYHKIEEYKI